MSDPKKEVPYHENDISAEEKIQSKGSRLQSENEYCRRTKGSGCEKSKGKKSTVSISGGSHPPFYFLY